MEKIKETVNSSKRIICTPSPSAKNAFFYVQETGCLVAGERAASHMQQLESFLFAAVIKGRGELSFGKESCTVSKGDCFFIDCRLPHSYVSSEDEPWKLLWVYFNGATSRQYYDHFVSHSKNVFRVASFDRAVSAITKIIGINEEKSPDSEILSSRYIMDLLTLSLMANSGDEEYDSALKNKLMAVHNYIEDHFNDDLSLEMLSTQFYISKFYLTREYKKIYGMTIFQHIITARINYGKKLLRFSDKSIDDIAHLCGFNDQSYFARQFKKSENITCFAYRKMWMD